MQLVQHIVGGLNKTVDGTAPITFAESKLHMPITKQANRNLLLAEDLDITMPRIFSDSLPKLAHTWVWTLDPLVKQTTVIHQQSRDHLGLITASGLAQQIQKLEFR